MSPRRRESCSIRSTSESALRAATGREPVIDYADDLKTTVSRVAARLVTVPETDAARPPAPGKWSSKEIIGHLDLLRRQQSPAVRAGAVHQNHLVLPRVIREEFVRVQQYQRAPWAELVTLWRDYISTSCESSRRSLPTSVCASDASTTWIRLPGSRYRVRIQ